MVTSTLGRVIRSRPLARRLGEPVTGASGWPLLKRPCPGQCCDLYRAPTECPFDPLPLGLLDESFDVGDGTIDELAAPCVLRAFAMQG